MTRYSAGRLRILAAFAAGVRRSWCFGYRTGQGELGAAVALFYGLVNDCATQYFAWSSALWLCLGLGAGGMLHALTGAFVYGLYALICGDWLLRTEWHYRSLAPWPGWLGWARDFSNLAFLVIGLAALAQGLAGELARARGRRAVTRADSGESPSPGG